MIRASIYILISIASLQLSADLRRGEEPSRPVRVAIIGFTHLATSRAIDNSVVPEARLAQVFASDARVVMIERDQFHPALSGIGYGGSINMSTLEARRIGAAIGCDFFITGKAELISRSERDNKSYEEAIIAVMIVDGRTGRLAVFDFIIEKAAQARVAFDAANKTLIARAESYAGRMLEFRLAREAGKTETSNTSLASRVEAGRIEEMPERGSPRAAGFQPPEMLNRVKPDYTDEADRADISATVEAMAVFLASGEVGDIEVMRWAGFGLDDAAVRAIRQLKFNPATRDGQPVSVRALIRYNFRRLAQAEASQPVAPQPEAAPADKPARDLRHLFKPRYRRP